MRMGLQPYWEIGIGIVIEGFNFDPDTDTDTDPDKGSGIRKDLKDLNAFAPGA